MQIKDYKSLVFFDTETTGFDAEKNRIIELAAVRLSNKGIYEMDKFIRLPDGGFIPDNITELTGITNGMLEEEGVPEMDAAAEFASLCLNGKTLLIAHNAQFDINFVAFMLIRYRAGRPEWLRAFNDCDYLDTMTVLKDRKAYPHKLANAIEYYGLSEKVQNTHRAIDDVKALVEVTKALQAERDDLADYINIFGYNAKYGISGKAFKKITYHTQPFRKSITQPEETLPAMIRKGGS